MKLLLIFGTRPEAIKLAPLLPALSAHPQLVVRTCATGQHRRLLDHALDAFDARPDHDLDLMRPGQQPGDFAARALEALGPVLDAEQPDLVVVQGDTTSALVGALGAHWRGIPVAHVEAGLRSGDLAAPFPEEGNRRLVDQVSAVHFAPTETARAHLLREGADPAGVHLTGNTGIDALVHTWERVRQRPLSELAPCAAGLVAAEGPLLLLTTHRRESFGAPIARVCEAVRRLVARHPLRVALPVHPNPAVDGPIRRALSDVAGVFLLPPLPYPAMVRLLGEADLVLTDSGGLQEEAPSLGRRVGVLRDTTERTEGLEAGAALAIGTDPARIEATVEAWLAEPEQAAFSGPNPYGDGRAAERIAAVLARRAHARRTG